MNRDVITHIRDLAEPIVTQHDMFIIDVEIKPEKKTVVWVYVDSESGGVSVDACSEISRELGFLMDAHDILTSGYRLNISSPGLSRPLSDRRQYAKNRGRKARVTFREGDETNKLTGVLKQVTGDKIEIEAGGNEVTIPFEDLLETTIVPTFDR